MKSGFEEMGLACDEQCLSRYRTYFENLEETNKVMNLTAISGEEDVARLHFLDCAAVLKMEDFVGKKVIDVGTGAGFPGLAMKMACPEMELTLLDSLDKRINFLKDTCAKTGIGDVTCIHARAEEIPEGYRESFDFAVSRAVARLNLLCELCLYAADLCVESLINISDLGVCIDVRLKKLVASLKLGDPGCLACLVSVHEMILVANRNCACSTENIAEISAERTKRGADDAESKAGIRLSVYVSIIFMFKSHNFFSFFFLFVLFFVFIYL